MPDTRFFVAKNLIWPSKNLESPAQNPVFPRQNPEFSKKHPVLTIFCRKNGFYPFLPTFPADEPSGTTKSSS